MASIVFWTLFGIDVAAVLAAAGFLIAGLADGSFSPANVAPGLVLLAIVAAVPACGWLLRSRGMIAKANKLLLLVAVPAVALCIFVAAAVILKPRWN